jgi:hypothetical protein
MRTGIFFGKRALALAAALFLIAGVSIAGTVGTVTHLSGVLSVKRTDGSTKVLAVKSDVLEGDVLSTANDTYARIKFIDSAELVLRPNSVLKVDKYAYKADEPDKDDVKFDMVKGGLRAVTGLLGKRNKERFGLNTPTATIGIRGTHLGALFCQNDCGGVPTPTGKTPDNGLHVDVASGAIVVTPKLTVALPTGGTPPANNMPLSVTGVTPGQVPGAPAGTGAAAGIAPPSGTPAPAVPSGPTNAPPAVVLNAGQFGYLPPPQNGVQPPLVLVPPSQAVQVRMPQSISNNNPGNGATNKNSDPECVVQ